MGTCGRWRDLRGLRGAAQLCRSPLRPRAEVAAVPTGERSRHGRAPPARRHAWPRARPASARIPAVRDRSRHRHGAPHGRAPRPQAASARLVKTVRGASASRPGAPAPASENPPPQDVAEKLTSLAKRRGFVFPSSEIYGGAGATWDFGPLGVELKRNVKDSWWRAMVQLRGDIVGLDGAILMHPRVWEASGHVENFIDPLVECRNFRKRFP